MTPPPAPVEDGEPAGPAPVPLRVLTVLERTAALGGRERAHLELCRALAARGHRLHLLTRAPGDLQGAFAEVATTRVLRPAGVKVLHDDVVGTAVPLAANVVEAARTRPDVVYVPARLLVALGAAVAGASGAGLVVHLHDQPRPLDRQDRWAWRRVDRAIAVSRAQAAAWTAVGVRPEQLVVVPNGVDLDGFSPGTRGDRARARAALGLPDAGPVVAVIGRVLLDKGVGVVAEAVARLRSAGTPAHLLVAGPSQGDDGDAACRAVRAALASEHVTFAGPLADPRPAFRAADVVAVASLTHDPAPLVLREALASGVPVVGTDVGGIPEVVAGLDPDLVVPPADPQALGEALGRAVAGGEGLRARARALARERYGPDPWVDGVEAALIAAAEARPAVRRRRAARRG